MPKGVLIPDEMLETIVRMPDVSSHEEIYTFTGVSLNNGAGSGCSPALTRSEQLISPKSVYDFSALVYSTSDFFLRAQSLAERA